MNPITLLRVLVVADLVLAFTGMGTELFFGWTLPPGLARYVHRSSDGPVPFHAIQAVLLLACSVLTIVSWVGLVTLRSFGRTLYVAAWALFLLFVAVSGPSVTTSVGAMVRLLHAMLGGVVIGLVYFSGLARTFEVRAALPRGLEFGADRA